MPGPTLSELKAKVEELQTSLDAEQQQVADALAAKDAAIAEKDTIIAGAQSTIESLNTTITSLEALVAEGGTAEERQAILDQISAAKTDLEGTIAP